MHILVDPVHRSAVPVHNLVDPGHGTNLWDGDVLWPAHKSVIV